MKTSTVIWFLLGGGVLYFVWTKFFTKASAGGTVPNYGLPASAPASGAHAAANATQPDSTWQTILKAIGSLAKAGGSILGGGGGVGSSASGKISDLFGGSKSGSTKPTSKEETPGRKEAEALAAQAAAESNQWTMDTWNKDESFSPLDESGNVSSPATSFGGYQNSWTPAPVYADTNIALLVPATFPDSNYNSYSNPPVYDFGSYNGNQSQIDYTAQNLSYSNALDFQANNALQQSFDTTFSAYDFGGPGVSGGYDFNPGDSGFENYA